MPRYLIAPILATLLIVGVGITSAQQDPGDQLPSAVPEQATPPADAPAVEDQQPAAEIDTEKQADLDANAPAEADVDVPAEADVDVPAEADANVPAEADVDVDVDADTKNQSDLTPEDPKPATPPANDNPEINQTPQPEQNTNENDARIDNAPFDPESPDLDSPEAESSQDVQLGLEIEKRDDRFQVRQIQQQGLFANSDLRVNDEIVSLNGRQFQNRDQLHRYVRDHRRQPMTAIVMRDGVRRSIDLRILDQDTAQNDVRQDGFAQNEQSVGRPVLGVWVLPTEDGLTVVGVAMESPAHQAGLQRGDKIMKVNGKPCDSPRGLIDCLEKAGMQEMAQIEFVRMGETQTAQVQLRGYDEVFALNDSRMNRPFSPESQRYESLRVDPGEFRQVRMQNLERQIDAMDQQLQQMRQELTQLQQRSPNQTGNNAVNQRPAPPLNGGAIQRDQPADQAPRLDAPSAPDQTDINPANGQGTVFDPNSVAPSGRLNQDD